MSPKKIVLLSRDVAPSLCFERLGLALQEKGLETQTLLGKGKPLPQSDEEIEKAVLWGDLLILGMSSAPSLAAQEIKAGQTAQQAGIIFGFYGDVPLCWGRARPGAWFENLAADTAFYFGPNRGDTEVARSVFPQARLFPSGNPLREDMAYPHRKREEVRSELEVEEAEKVILCPGDKFAAGNMVSWALVIEALTLLTQENGPRFRLILTTHPGDQTDRKLYEELLSFSRVPASLAKTRSSDLVPGADLIIEFGSSIGIEGAYQRIPLVTLAPNILQERLKQMSGSRETEVAINQCSALVTSNSLALAQTIKRLLTPAGSASQRGAQETAYPKLTRGSAIREMTTAIQSLLA